MWWDFRYGLGEGGSDDGLFHYLGEAWAVRKQRLLSYGLPCFLQFRHNSKFSSLEISPLPGFTHLIRTVDLARYSSSPYHITLMYTDDYRATPAHHKKYYDKKWHRLRRAFKHPQRMVLRVRWVDPWTSVCTLGPPWPPVLRRYMSDVRLLRRRLGRHGPTPTVSM